MWRQYLNSSSLILLLGALSVACVPRSTDEPEQDTDTDTDTDSNSENGSQMYAPDNGPSHDLGVEILVDSEAAILAAIEDAHPGDVITLEPGTYSFDTLIRVQRDGTEEDRVFLRAAALGTVTVYLSHIENFKVHAKYWVFENIIFEGMCSTGAGCEHAFHIVGDADDLIFRNNEVVNFASHVKLNGEFVDGEPLKQFPDRTWFIGNFWHNTKYVPNNAPHNVLNLDGGKDHVVRGNIFADYSAPASLPKSASAVYPKASTLGILIEQNLIVCEKQNTEGETTRGIQLGDGAPASICDGDTDGDGLGDCEENGQNQEGLIRNNIIMNCDNGGSSTGIMASSDRESLIAHNTVYNVGARNGAFYVGHPAHETYWTANILENGFNTNYAVQELTEQDNLSPTFAEMTQTYTAPENGDFSLLDDMFFGELNLKHPQVTHDFCGYPRGEETPLGAIEYATAYDGVDCASIVQQMYARIP